MKPPNRKRKYNPLFYALIILSILLCSTFFINVGIDRRISEYEENLVEGVDFESEDFLVSRKEVEHDVSITIWDLFSVYNNGRVENVYYVIDQNERKIRIDQVMFDDISEGDMIKIYSTDGKEYYSTAIEAKRAEITQNNELISFALIILPVFGIFLLLYLIVLRKKMLNPYYERK